MAQPEHTDNGTWARQVATEIWRNAEGKIHREDGPATSLDMDQLERLALDDDPFVSCNAFRHHDFASTPEKIEHWLTHENSYIRAYTIYMNPGIQLTTEQIERALTDVSSGVRSTFIDCAARDGLTLTPEQVERGLLDEENWGMRQYVQQTGVHLAPSREQIERGLDHDNSSIREFFAERADYTPSPEQVEDGLTDPADSVVRAFARRTDIKLTPEQIERGLTDESPDVRVQFVRRTDAELTPEQVLRGLRDPVPWVRKVFAQGGHQLPPKTPVEIIEQTKRASGMFLGKALGLDAGRVEISLLRANQVVRIDTPNSESIGSIKPGSRVKLIYGKKGVQIEVKGQEKSKGVAR